ncbi:MAG TPA: 50S ribosomal protein L35 [Caldisericia bacterium]|jgi:large subunit ribosomal protein L35|nr:50S ribosomal protein L35 [Caldisericia bacterium]
MKNKIRSCRGAMKRFKVTGTGKIMYMPTGHSHFMEKKSAGTKAGQRCQREVPKSDYKNVRARIINVKL